ncbi:MAG: C_GCAxxG_C_C family protein [Chloroflexi bacterium]|nr:C_GCAxxG_C_C family protein [Chloroflexota bacterium]
MSDRETQPSEEFGEGGYYCAESVLLTLARKQGIQSDLIPRIATGFCSGMARTGGMCGAVTGAMMGLNLLAGRDLPSESFEETYAMIQKLLGMFEDRFGSTNCMELIDCDLNTEQGQRDYLANNREEQCGGYVDEAIRMATSLIEEFEPSNRM